MRTHTGNDPKRAEQAYSAAAGTILRGIEAKSQTKEGAASIWDMLRKHVEQGNVPPEAPSPQSRAQVRELDPKAANEMMREIFGNDAPNVEGGFAKVITLDRETSKKIFQKVLPTVLGGVLALPNRILRIAPRHCRKLSPMRVREMEQRQPKSAGVFDAILDRDHDGDVDLDDLAGFFARKPK